MAGFSGEGFRGRSRIWGHLDYARIDQTLYSHLFLEGIGTALGARARSHQIAGAIGIGAPQNTPAEVSGYLNDKVNAALADPKMKARLADLGGIPMTGTPAEFGKVMAAETEKWAKAVKFSGASIE